MATVTLTGAQALVRLLQAEAVPAAFGIVGGKLAALLHALSQSPIAFVGVRHEAAAPMMAAAVFASQGRVAVALGEMGPGALNLAAGAGVAFNNNLAVLLITTNQHRAAAYPHQGMFMDMDTRAVLAPLTKWGAVVHDARRLPALVRTAFREALSGRPGPVHLDIPHDVLTTSVNWRSDEFDIGPDRYRATSAPRPAAHSVAAAAALLQGARRPLIVAGG
ncbi:MAG: thiamine pyrophosphate-binding protein, partial [Rubrivivax sp.]|nr:thiamine pyrophosphate-binding protein [Rubrivivax sp.]